MQQRIVAAASALLFLLIAVVAAIMTDVHDRSYPVAVGATSTLYLDYSESGLTDDRALTELAERSQRADIELYKIQPSMNGNQQAQNLAALGNQRRVGEVVGWYGDQPPARILPRRALAHSFATGSYLVAGSRSGLDAMTRSLELQRVRVRREDDGPFQTVEFALRQGSFRATVAATAALLIALSLFWISLRSRSRALRVLNGTAPGRIQRQDLGLFAALIAAPIVPVGVTAGAVLGFTHGWAYVPYFASTFLGAGLVLLGIALAAAILIATTSWPTAALLATRAPTVGRLRRPTLVLKAVIFLLLLGTSGPAWLAYRDAAAVARQQQQWRSLADQVALQYPGGLGEAGFERIRDKIGLMTATADRRHAAALSYAMGPEQLGDADFGRYDRVAVVNPEWLSLMLQDDGAGAVRPIAPSAVPASIMTPLRANLALWFRDPTYRPRFMETTGDVELPLAEGGNGELAFTTKALLLVVPDAGRVFTADYLASLSSSRNLVFTGLEPTLALLRSQGLENDVRVVYAAEDGILRAQFSRYQAWLRAISLIALATAFALAAGVGAAIAAMSSARRDVNLRLAGHTWWAIVWPRVGTEWAVGGVLAVALIATQSFDVIPITALVGTVALGLIPISQAVASRWCFHAVQQRRM